VELADAVAEGFGVLAEHDAAGIRAAFPWLPALAEVLDECRGMLVNIEIKYSPRAADFDPEERVAAAVVELLRARTDDRVLVSSFHLPTIDRVHALDPAIATGYLTVLAPPPLAALETAVAGGHRAIHPFFGALADDMARAVTTRAHELGVDVNTWTVNEPADVVRLAAAGVDALVTDVPADVLGALA
jgi:glycerophosphoryl diester phosphodiesterase